MTNTQNLSLKQDIFSETQINKILEIDKSPLLAKALFHGIASKQLQKMDFSALTAIIGERETEKKNTMNYLHQEAVNAFNAEDELALGDNVLAIQPLPRLSLQVLTTNEYGEFELELLDKAKLYGLAIPYISKDSVNFNELADSIEQYESLDEDDKFFVEQARNYHIPIKASHLQDIMTLAFEIEDYASLLSRANDLRINWKMSVYDPNALAAEIARETFEIQTEYWHYRNSLIQNYRTMREVV